MSRQKTPGTLYVEIAPNSEDQVWCSTHKILLGSALAFPTYLGVDTGIVICPECLFEDLDGMIEEGDIYESCG